MWGMDPGSRGAESRETDICTGSWKGEGFTELLEVGVRLGRGHSALKQPAIFSSISSPRMLPSGISSNWLLQSLPTLSLRHGGLYLLGSRVRMVTRIDKIPACREPKGEDESTSQASDNFIKQKCSERIKQGAGWKIPGGGCRGLRQGMPLREGHEMVGDEEREPTGQGNSLYLG